MPTILNYELEGLYYTGKTLANIIQAYLPHALLLQFGGAKRAADRSINYGISQFDDLLRRNDEIVSGVKHTIKEKNTFVLSLMFPLEVDKADNLLTKIFNDTVTEFLSQVEQFPSECLFVIPCVTKNGNNHFISLFARCIKNNQVEIIGFDSIGGDEWGRYNINIRKALETAFTKNDYEISTSKTLFVSQFSDNPSEEEIKIQGTFCGPYIAYIGSKMNPALALDKLCTNISRPLEKYRKDPSTWPKIIQEQKQAIEDYNNKLNIADTAPIIHSQNFPQNRTSVSSEYTPSLFPAQQQMPFNNNNKNFTLQRFKNNELFSVNPQPILMQQSSNSDVHVTFDSGAAIANMELLDLIEGLKTKTSFSEFYKFFKKYLEQGAYPNLEIDEAPLIHHLIANMTIPQVNQAILLLIDQPKFDVNATSARGNTALHKLLVQPWNSSIEPIVIKLLTKNPNLRLINSSNQTCLDSLIVSIYSYLKSLIDEDAKDFKENITLVFSTLEKLIVCYEPFSYAEHVLKNAFSLIPQRIRNKCIDEFFKENINKIFLNHFKEEPKNFLSARVISHSQSSNQPATNSNNNNSSNVEQNSNNQLSFEIPYYENLKTAIDNKIKSVPSHLTNSYSKLATAKLHILLGNPHIYAQEEDSEGLLKLSSHPLDPQKHCLPKELRAAVQTLILEFIKEKADITWQNLEGQNAFHLLAQWGDQSNSSILFLLGALLQSGHKDALNKTDRKGNTPLDYAQRSDIYGEENNSRALSYGSTLDLATMQTNQRLTKKERNEKSIWRTMADAKTKEELPQPPQKKSVLSSLFGRSGNNNNNNNSPSSGSSMKGPGKQGSE